MINAPVWSLKWISNSGSPSLPSACCVVVIGGIRPPRAWLCCFRSDSTSDCLNIALHCNFSVISVTSLGTRVVAAPLIVKSREGVRFVRLFLFCVKMKVNSVRQRRIRNFPCAFAKKTGHRSVGEGRANTPGKTFGGVPLLLLGRVPLLLLGRAPLLLLGRVPLLLLGRAKRGACSARAACYAAVHRGWQQKQRRTIHPKRRKLRYMYYFTLRCAFERGEYPAGHAASGSSLAACCSGPVGSA